MQDSKLLALIKKGYMVFYLEEESKFVIGKVYRDEIYIDIENYEQGIVLDGSIYKCKIGDSLEDIID